eukprot:jgi/Chlat1/4165/Chrsp27S04268
METASNPERCSDYPILCATLEDLFSVPAEGYFSPDPFTIPDIAAWRPSVGIGDEEQEERRDQKQQQQQQQLVVQVEKDEKLCQSATVVLHKLWDISDSCLADFNHMRNKAAGATVGNMRNHANLDDSNKQSASSSSEDGSPHSQPGSNSSKKQRKAWLDPTSHITKEMLQAAFQMQIKDAADFMGVGRTYMKLFARRLGIPRWPYRQLRSLDRIQDYIAQLDSEHQLPELLCSGSANKLLSHQRSIITSNPGAPLSQAFRRHRQTLYKKMFQLRKRTTTQILSARSVSSPL